MRKLSLLFIGLPLLLGGCSNDIEQDRIPTQKVPRYVGTQTRAGIFDDYEVVSNEIVVLNDYATPIYPGAAFTMNSVVNATFKPISGTNQPITLSTTLINTGYEKFDKATRNNFLKYLSNQYKTASFEENPEFQYSMDTFTSYNELESVTGTSKSTSYLFFKKGKLDKNEDRRISKRTGIYIKFWQSSFSVIMDDPKIPYVTVDKNMQDSVVFVNSITYGRLGIIALETEMNAEEAKSLTQKSFSAIVVNGEESLTSEQKRFLQNCDAHVYIQGGNNKDACQTIDGLSAFTNYIQSGRFSRNQSGVPIFASFEKVKDNSLAQIKFKFHMRSHPIYVDFVDSIHNGVSHLSIHFYKNRAMTPALAHAEIEFKFEVKKWYDHEVPGKYEDGITYHSYYNKNYDKGIHLMDYEREKVLEDPKVPSVIHEYTQVRLLDNPDFELIGDNPRVVYY